MLTYIELCAGIGGIGYGLEMAGDFRCVAQVERDPFCNIILEKHWPHVPRFNDLENFDLDAFPDYADLITAGFPCQPHSTAGKRKGRADSRNLWPLVSGIIGYRRPAWVILENVSGLRTTIADEVLGDLAGLGYAARATVVGADHLGAPHQRRRVWIVAHRMGHAMQSAEHAKGVHEGEREPSRTSSPMAKPAVTGLAIGTSRASHADNGADQPQRSGDSQLAHTARNGHLTGQRSNGQRTGAGDYKVVADADGGRSGKDQLSAQLRTTGPVQSPGYPRVHGQPSEGGQVPQWPAGRGRPQHDWEVPRLLELPVGRTVDGVSRRLVQRNNVEALRAYGNSVVSQVVSLFGKFILAVEAGEVSI